MRHRNAGFKLGRNTSHRRALLGALGVDILHDAPADAVAGTTVTRHPAEARFRKMFRFAP